MPPSKMTFSIASAAAVCLVLLCVHKPSAQAALPTSAGLVLAVDANAGKPVAYASHARPARAGETIANQSEAADDFGVVTDTANAAGVNTTEAAAEAPCKNEPGCKYVVVLRIWFL